MLARTFASRILPRCSGGRCSGNAFARSFQASRTYSTLPTNASRFSIGSRVISFGTSRGLRLLLGAGGTSALAFSGYWMIGGLHTQPIVQCEEKPLNAKNPATASIDGPVKAKRQNPIIATLAIIGAVGAWGFLVSIWASAIVTPFIFLGAIITGKWKVAGALTGMVGFVHVVPVPVVPFFREIMANGIKRWFGPLPMSRVVDLSGSAPDEPEPEPRAKGDGGTKQLFCYHPHGIYSLGVFEVQEARRDVRVLSSPFLYHLAPLFRLAATSLLGLKMGSVHKSDLTALMKKGDSPMMLVPGGFHEATIACPGHERVFLKNRKGFVVYALRHGYDLVPVYCIGESDLMNNPQGGWGLRFFLNNLSIPAVLPWGFPLLPLLPRRGVELVTTIGPPLKMPHIPNPTKADIKAHHERYMRALQDVYERAKIGTASENRKLEIW